MRIRIHVPRFAGAAIATLSHLLIWGGVAAIALYLWSESDRRIYQAVQSSYISQPASSSIPPRPPVLPVAPKPAGSWNPWQRDPLVIARLEIPRLQINVIVRKGIDGPALRRSVGHMPGTPLPGQPGNAVFAAHRDGLFRPLRRIERGDLIRVIARDALFSYRVDGLAIVPPDALDILAQTEQQRLTLITCYPFDFIGNAPKRFVVFAAREH